MLTIKDLAFSFGGTVLFEEVNAKFIHGNCYGLIGANGAGKSTFLKLLSGEIEPSAGQIHLETRKRIAVLRQDQFAFDSFNVVETVLMGHQELYRIYSERSALYAKTEMTEEEGMRVGELEGIFGEMDGYNAESDAETLLSNLGIDVASQRKTMGELEAGQKIRVLLAQVLFGDPDVLLLDEPTNQLDYETCLWLENYLLEFKNLVIVVSHDRHFLNKVCSHIADVDFKKIHIFTGNYAFWQESTTLMTKQRQDQHKKSSEKIQELEAFIRRFSANASKSKQATSRRKLIEKIRPEDLPVSSRKSPYIRFKSQKPVGESVLTVENICHSISGQRVLSNVNFSVSKGDKVAIVGKNTMSKTILLQILSGEITPDSGTLKWSDSTNLSYFPKDNSQIFNSALGLLEWLTQFSLVKDPQILRGFLGQMLFSGEDVFKKISVLSGGEKARAMFSKMMAAQSNVLIFDEPTDHLDLESISSLNDALEKCGDVMILTSHDFQLLSTTVNRVIEVSPKGIVDFNLTFEEFNKSPTALEKRALLY